MRIRVLKFLCLIGHSIASVAWINNPHLFPVFWYRGRHFGGIWRYSFDGCVVRRAYLEYHFTRQSFYLKNSRYGKKTSVSVFASVHLSSILNLSFVSHFLFVCVNNLIYMSYMYFFSAILHVVFRYTLVTFYKSCEVSQVTSTCEWRLYLFSWFWTWWKWTTFRRHFRICPQVVLIVFPTTLNLESESIGFVILLTHSENQLPSPSAEKSFSVQSLLGRIQDLESNMLAMKEKMVRFSYRLKQGPL